MRANTTSFLILDSLKFPTSIPLALDLWVGAYVTHDKGRRFALTGLSERVRNAMRVSHVEQFFQFYETAMDAQDTHKPSGDLSALAREAEAPVANPHILRPAPQRGRGATTIPPTGYELNLGLIGT